jgi:hypothetical protein
MIQTAIGNKYGFDMQVSARIMADGDCHRACVKHRRVIRDDASLCRMYPDESDVTVVRISPRKRQTRNIPHSVAFQIDAYRLVRQRHFAGMFPVMRRRVH